MTIVLSRGKVGLFLLAAVCLAPWMHLHPLMGQPGLLDGNEDFRLLARLGFAEAVDGSHRQGGPANSYAWSMKWFKGALFVGTVQREQNRRAQIWRYTPAGPGGASGTWQLAFQSPAILGRGIDLGYRWMTVCACGGRERLYVTTLGPSRGRILYSEEGSTFREASGIGLAFNDIGYRPLVCFSDPGGRALLITSPVGVAGNSGDSDGSLHPHVLATSDPIRGRWYRYSPTGFGDPTNESIFSMDALDLDGDQKGDSALYAGISNRTKGLQIWKTAGCQSFPCMPQWNLVVDKGAGRPLNAQGLSPNWGVSDFGFHDGAMYAGLSDSASNAVPAELIRINRDDTWELLIGEPRLNLDANSLLGLICPPATLDGIGSGNDCTPHSGRGAGFGDLNDGFLPGTVRYFWHLTSYAHDPARFPMGDGRLYVGTLDGGSNLDAGFDLLATADGGLSWSEISQDGLGDPSQFGARTLETSPVGLFVGGASLPSAVIGSDALGGCSVWMGTCDPELAVPPVVSAAVRLKSSAPGMTIFEDGVFSVFDDESYPLPGEGQVTLTLESQSQDPFCGVIVDRKWDAGNLVANCGSLPGTLGSDATLEMQACTPAGRPEDCPGIVPSSSTADFNGYTFTLQETDDDGNFACDTVTVRVWSNLPPAVSLLTDPPYLASTSQGGSLNLIDFDANGVESLGIAGLCDDPEGLPTLGCDWSDPKGVIAPFADPDPGIPGPKRWVAVRTGQTPRITLKATDSSGHETTYSVDVRVTDPRDVEPSINNRPLCQGAAMTTPRDSPLHIDPSLGPFRCVDPEAQPLAYHVTQPAQGTGSVTVGAGITYLPPSGFLGSASFTAYACDPYGRCSDPAAVEVLVHDGVPPEPPAPPPLSPPSKPAAAAVRVLSGRTVRISWLDVAGETWYEVQRCQGWSSCRYTTIADAIPADQLSLDQTLRATQLYRFRVRACNEAGCSAYAETTQIWVR